MVYQLEGLRLILVCLMQKIFPYSKSFGKKILRNIELFDIYEDEKIGKDNKSYAVSFTFRDDTKTLQDNDIEGVMKKLMEEYQSQLNAIIR